MMFERQSPIPLYGTRLTPTRPTLRALVAALKSQVQSDLRSPSLAEMHNGYALYTTALLLCATAHRPVTDPFPRRSHLSPELQLALISDKVVTPRHDWRLCVLPSMAGEAVRHYEIHLAALAFQLHAAGAHRLAHAIAALARGNDPSVPIPFLFLLDETLERTRSITRTAIERYFEPHFAFPANVFRHGFATWAAATDVHSVLTEYQLAHLPTLSHPFGVSGVQSPRMFAELLEPAIARWLDELAWESLPGLIGPRRRPLCQGRGEDASGIQPVHENHLLGPDRRRKYRNAKETIDRTIVRQALYETLGPTPNKSISADQGTAIQQRIVDLSTEQTHRTNRRLRLLWRYWSAQRRRGVRIDSKARLYNLSEEPSPFTEFSLQDYEQVQACRSSFADYLTHSGRSAAAPTVLRRLAEIVVSAALFGSLADKPRLQQLVLGVQESCQVVGDFLVVDLHERRGLAKSPVLTGRWVADPSTRNLIAGLWKLEDTSSGHGLIQHSSRDLVRELTQLSRDIGVSAHRLDPYGGLAKSAGAAALLELPPVLREVATGRLPYQPLPATALGRLITKKRLSGLGSAQQADSDHSEQLLTGASTLTSHAKSAMGEFVRVLRQEVTRLTLLRAKGQDRSKESRKKALKKFARDLVQNAGEPLPPLAIAIASWVYSLCESGTPYKTALAFRTVADYTRHITRGLPRIAGHLDYFNLSDAEYEEVYLQSLDYTKETHRPYVARRLREFHHYLVAALGVDEPDWSAILGSDAESGRVDANLITPLEYRKAHSLIATSRSLTKLLRLQCQTLLLLGYRFGLRIGEALRLQPKDIQLSRSEEFAIVLVRPNVFGTTKSPAGVRQIPLRDRMEESEWTALQSLLEDVRSRAERDPQVALFAEAGTPRQTVARTTAARVIHTALRQVTGDPSVRYHHLRHTYAMRTHLEPPRVWRRLQLLREWSDEQVQ